MYFHIDKRIARSLQAFFFGGGGQSFLYRIPWGLMYTIECKVEGHLRLTLDCVPLLLKIQVRKIKYDLIIYVTWFKDINYLKNNPLTRYPD